jgi:peptidoglycan/xylan/chitin deacetylase (PgdA/CDA1 family)
VPILKQFRVPAIIYVTTGFVEGSVFPFEYHLANIVLAKPRLSFEWNGREVVLATEGESEKDSAYQKIKMLLKSAEHDVREQVLAEMDGTNRYQFGVKYLKIEQVKAATREPLVTVGSHTHYHQELTRVTRNAAEMDIGHGKTMLEEWIGEEVKDFAYPYGAYDEEVCRLVRTAGFVSAVTTAGNCAGTEPCGRRFRIPRKEVS